MRHLKTGRKLNRNSSHRKAMFRNMAVSLFAHEMIKTTLPKAKELRRVAEPLITLAKVDCVANRRLAFSRLRDKQAVSKLFDNLAPRLNDRLGGYLSVLKCGFRRGDSAPMALVMLVDYDDRQLNDSLDRGDQQQVPTTPVLSDKTQGDVFLPSKENSNSQVGEASSTSIEISDEDEKSSEIGLKSTVTEDVGESVPDQAEKTNVVDQENSISEEGGDQPLVDKDKQK